MWETLHANNYVKKKWRENKIKINFSNVRLKLISYNFYFNNNKYRKKEREINIFFIVDM